MTELWQFAGIMVAMAGVLWAISQFINRMEARIKSELGVLSDKFHELRGEVRTRFQMQDSENMTLGISREISKIFSKANSDK